MPQFNDPEYLKELDYYYKSPRELTLPQVGALRRLLARSTNHDQPRLSPVVASSYAESIMRKANNLNAWVGKPGSRPYQRYARTMIAFAVDPDKDQAIGMQIVANNASGHEHYPVPRPLRRAMKHWPNFMESGVRAAEMRAKLHVLPAHVARWHWFGARAVEPQTLPNHAPFPVSSDLTLPDVLAFLTLRWKPSDQQTSAYPYHTEVWWQTSLQEWGMTEDTAEERRLMPAFGREVEAEPAWMSHWTGTVGAVRAAIDSKPDNEGLIRHAIVNSEMSRLERA